MGKTTTKACEGIVTTDAFFFFGSAGYPTSDKRNHKWYKRVKTVSPVLQEYKSVTWEAKHTSTEISR